MSTDKEFIKQNEVIIGERSLPVLHDCDAVIVGGSFAGTAAAIELANSGKSVALIESRTYLGREMTATLRPWLKHFPGKWNEAVVPDFVKEIGRHGTALENETALQMDEVKLKMEDALIHAGVKILYASLPIGISSEEQGKKMLVIGNKSGRQVIKGEVVIDTTETANEVGGPRS